MSGGPRGIETAPQPSWSLGDRTHQRWLLRQADRLLTFFAAHSMDPDGGFFALDNKGKPRATATRDIVTTARMVHCYSLAHLMDDHRAAPIVEHGLTSLQDMFHDHVRGGFYWNVSKDGTAAGDVSKQAYGHAFVLLAAASARQAGFGAADPLLDAVDDALENHFWDEAAGLYQEQFTDAWGRIDQYRGGNSNMHMVEALLAAYESTTDPRYLARAESIADRLINQVARANQWRPVEHFTESWTIDADYNRGDPRNIYRPFGSVVGHATEWSRLLLQLRGATGTDVWYTTAAQELFAAALQAWDDTRGGLFYTVDFSGHVLDHDHYQWPISESIGAAAGLATVTGNPHYAGWYQRLWDFAAENLFDRANGGWHYVLGPDLHPIQIPGAAEGKPDLYHALQSCLLPMFDPGSGLARSLRQVAARQPART